MTICAFFPMKIWPPASSPQELLETWCVPSLYPSSTVLHYGETKRYKISLRAVRAIFNSGGWYVSTEEDSAALTSIAHRVYEK